MSDAGPITASTACRKEVATPASKHAPESKRGSGATPFRQMVEQHAAHAREAKEVDQSGVATVAAAGELPADASSQPAATTPAIAPPMLPLPTVETAVDSSMNAAPSPAATGKRTLVKAAPPALAPTAPHAANSTCVEPVLSAPVSKSGEAMPQNPQVRVASVTEQPSAPIHPVAPLDHGKSASTQSEAARAQHVGDALPATHQTQPWADAPALLSAAPNSLEIGVSAGIHGWLRIRAELSDTGSVAAQVTASTPHAAQHLQQEIPAISAFLASEHVGLSDLFVYAADAQAGTQDSMQGSSHAGSDRSSEHHPQTYLEATPQESSAIAWSGVPAWVSRLSSPLYSAQPAGLGGWLSVRV